eukprot:TRINITY_DN125_c0_g2_i1.p1 TRINITY_DN125_c0_g2~~TRINITY_DN125_c0_g2_i1.p1  ORF type:complete len:317 (-),score=90.35 TRINITY_DN125_c0_g2_i1:464-1342(-)
MVFSILPNRCFLKGGSRGHSAVARAAATEPQRLFSDREWEQAFQSAVDLKKAQEATESMGESIVDDKGDRLFSDTEWKEAITEALKEAAVASAAADSSAEASASPDVVPEGRVFSDRQWSDSISASLAMRQKELDAIEAGEDGVSQGDRLFTDTEWKVATKVALEIDLTEEEMGTKKIMDKQITMTEAMSFSGPAPETINGRLAMLGFISALGAEAGSGQSIADQLAAAPLPIAITFATFVTASIIPIVKGTDEEATLGPFTPQAEVLNGRLAMVGMLALLAIEASKGGAFL